jgi:thiol-disulfide isomerase/thioredoxin
MRHVRRSLASLTAIFALIGTISFLSIPAYGQSPNAPDVPPMLPTDPDQWINSGPLTYDGMRGKAAVLWYFEETCPKCAGKWPALKQLAAENSEHPVLFIAVNSGTHPRELLGYIRRHEIDWPVIVDIDRSFEQASGVGEISLQRIHQVRVMKADGQFTWGRWDDLPGTVETALVGAEWKVKYDRLHPIMHPAVRRMEFGDYRSAAFAIKSGRKDKSPEVRRAAEQVSGFVDRQMGEALEQALKKVPADDAWAKFEAHTRLAKQFAPQELPKEAADELKRLSRDPAIQEELRAAKAVDANAGALSSPDERIRQRAVKVLERVLKNYPETRSAARAKELLDKDEAGDAAR